MILFQEENEDMIYMEKARSSDVHKIGDLFAFKVNLNTICVDSQAYMLVKIIDEDVPDSKIEPIPIRVQYTFQSRIAKSLHTAENRVILIRT